MLLYRRRFTLRRSVSSHWVSVEREDADNHLGKALHDARVFAQADPLVNIGQSIGGNSAVSLTMYRTSLWMGMRDLESPPPCTATMCNAATCVLNAENLLQ